jgi:hypothetical protein
MKSVKVNAMAPDNSSTTITTPNQTDTMLLTPSFIFYRRKKATTQGYGFLFLSHKDY